MQKATKKILESFDNPDVLGIVSSYPSEGREIARKNAISRYTYLLAKNFPKGQKAVIFCEFSRKNKPYLVQHNILVVPSYKINSLGFLKDLVLAITKFKKIENFLIQFEFSIYGGKIVIPQFLMLLGILKLIGKSVKIVLHQIVTDLGSLSGHLAIREKSLKTYIFNILLKIFYLCVGIFTDIIFVHDNIFADKITGLVSNSKVRVVPHGVEFGKNMSKKENISGKKSFGVYKDTKLIGIFGYCSWYKGTDWLIENFSRFTKNHRDLKIKLLIAGGESPTLKGTSAYKKYHVRLRKVVKEANGNIIYTGYLPQKDVKNVFAACDLMVFPYRTKMSASGAFSISLGYRKNFIASDRFLNNLEFGKNSKNVFSLNYDSFERCLLENIAHPSGSEFTGNGVSWQNSALLYLKESLRNVDAESKLEYAKVF